MSVISEQHAHAYDKTPVHGGDKWRLPKLDDKPMIDYWRDRYNRAEGWAARIAVARDAVAALELARRAPVPDEPAFNDPRWKRWVAQSPLDAGEIARKFNVSRQYVYQVRARYGSIRR